MHGCMHVCVSVSIEFVIRLFASLQCYHASTLQLTQLCATTYASVYLAAYRIAHVQQHTMLNPALYCLCIIILMLNVADPKP